VRSSRVVLPLLLTAILSSCGRAELRPAASATTFTPPRHAPSDDRPEVFVTANALTAEALRLANCDWVNASCEDGSYPTFAFLWPVLPLPPAARAVTISTDHPPTNWRWCLTPSRVDLAAMPTNCGDIDGEEVPVGQIAAGEWDLTLTGTWTEGASSYVLRLKR
jgi:hypothetical protein